MYQGGCHCSQLVTICFTNLVRHACWRHCCKHWVSPNPASSRCSVPTSARRGVLGDVLTHPAGLRTATLGRVAHLAASLPAEERRSSSGRMTRYLIFSAHRSASTTLCWALAQHPGIECRLRTLLALTVVTICAAASSMPAHAPRALRHYTAPCEPTRTHMGLPSPHTTMARARVPCVMTVSMAAELVSKSDLPSLSTFSST